MVTDIATRLKHTHDEVHGLRQDIEALFVIAMDLADMADDEDEADRLRDRVRRIFGTAVHASHGIQVHLAKTRAAIRAEQAPLTDDAPIDAAAEE